MAPTHGAGKGDPVPPAPGIWVSVGLCVFSCVVCEFILYAHVLSYKHMYLEWFVDFSLLLISQVCMFGGTSVGVHFKD